MGTGENGLLAVLAAKQEITEVLHSYARGLDRMDRGLADSVWHADGTADYGPSISGLGTEFLDYVWAFHERFECHSHLIGNVLIQVDAAGDRAVSEAYVAVWLRGRPVDGEVVDQFHRGRYVDEWSRRDGVWAIAHRTFIADIMHEARNPAGPQTWGSRGTADPSYRILG
ncbi:nuclear transport factor 2 family protein [Tomitella biformata]|uniref:nuclear transport factor 2 family protein n=1 Tax=Tomitella biformata TaxID=630403 RepID=UPI0004B8D9E6|nr:nuclear transport factor 2 family protein [Tomitella biformata]